MSLTLSIIILLSVFALLLVSDMIHPILCAGILFMFYMWGLIAFDMTLLQKVFYPIGIVFFMAAKANLGKDLQTNATSMDVNGVKPGGIVKGLKYHVLSIIIGIVILFVMTIISSSKGQFLGITPLSVTGVGMSAWITAQFAPAISLSLAFIENRMFIAWLNILLLSRPAIQIGLTLIPLLGFLAPISLILPIVITAATFGLFHIIAYNVMWSLIWWASMIMIIWIISYYLTGRDTTAMDTAHGGWNGWLTAKESLSIAF